MLSTSVSERLRFREFVDGGGVCDGGGFEKLWKERAALMPDVEGVKRPCARPWFSRRRAEPGIIGGGARVEGTLLRYPPWAPMLEKEEDAERGRGDAEPAPPPTPSELSELSEFVLGVKSNRGDRSGATPYCNAMSLPRSRGILITLWSARYVEPGDKRVPGSLIFAVSTLDDFVLAWEYFLLENLGPAPFVDARDFENLGRIHVGVISPTHYCNAPDHAFVDLVETVTRPGETIRDIDRGALPAPTSRPHCRS